jgi:hypothetical protein
MQHHGAGKVQPTASPLAILKVGASSTGAAEASAAMHPKLTFRRLYVVRLLHRVLWSQVLLLSAIRRAERALGSSFCLAIVGQADALANEYGGTRH